MAVSWMKGWAGWWLRRWPQLPPPPHITFWAESVVSLGSCKGPPSSTHLSAAPSSPPDRHTRLDRELDRLGGSERDSQRGSSSANQRVRTALRPRYDRVTTALRPRYDRVTTALRRDGGCSRLTPH
ncbi:hypothetical protein EYF80_023664 [Liparis tanakae]|uniref:Uncharacterized protein n=1 Tax=Liparis tanakae TaxID=230148 RepID=A0A4Z2HK91_9TELE|nr:hypothetical protein EYF80_023664 [Liparis tanakae]